MRFEVKAFGGKWQHRIAPGRSEMSPRPKRAWRSSGKAIRCSSRRSPARRGLWLCRSGTRGFLCCCSARNCTCYAQGRALPGTKPWRRSTERGIPRAHARKFLTRINGLHAGGEDFSMLLRAVASVFPGALRRHGSARRSIPGDLPVSLSRYSSLIACSSMKCARRS
jgi:hypothetical protein